MHEVNLQIEPNEKYRNVIGTYSEPGAVETDEDEWEDWPEEHQKAADNYIKSVDEAAIKVDRVEDLGDGKYRISCTTCSRSWTMAEERTKEIDPEVELRSRLDAHLPCDSAETLSWDHFSVSSDPDLVAKIATYFDGMTSDEPTGRLRAKLRLLDCEIYAKAQLAANAELQDADGPSHYEFNGHLYCEITHNGFEWASEDPLQAPDECPHCGVDLQDG